MELKFRPVDTNQGYPFKYPEKTIQELITSGQTYDKYLQYVGFCDAKKQEIYQGDILELAITDEMMDINKNGFANSNLAKDLRNHPKVISVLCHINYKDFSRIGCYYDIYYMDRDRNIVNSEDEVEKDEIPTIASGSDNLFPAYLCEKGAIVITNTETCTGDAFRGISEWTQFTPYVPIPQHAVMNLY